MRIIRIYQPGHYELGDTLTLSPEAVQHIVTVLRLRLGQFITLFCGDNREFIAAIVSMQKREVVVKIEQVKSVDRESPLHIHLAQGISKGERMEWVIQKSVELGVASITPILTARSVVRLDNERTLKKEMHWQAIATHACEQCGRNQIPPVHATCLFEPFIQQARTNMKWILSPEADDTLDDYQYQQGDSMTVLIGPEGGLSDEEVDSAIEAGFRPLRLGPRILRTETAAVAIISLLQARYGDLST